MQRRGFTAENAEGAEKRIALVRKSRGKSLWGLSEAPR
jgi:hypothetical protein